MNIPIFYIEELPSIVYNFLDNIWQPFIIKNSNFNLTNVDEIILTDNTSKFLVNIKYTKFENNYITITPNYCQVLI